MISGPADNKMFRQGYSMGYEAGEASSRESVDAYAAGYDRGLYDGKSEFEDEVMLGFINLTFEEFRDKYLDPFIKRKLSTLSTEEPKS